MPHHFENYNFNYFTSPMLETMLGNSIDLAPDQIKWWRSAHRKQAQSWTKMVTQWTLPIEIKLFKSAFEKRISCTSSWLVRV